MSKRFSTSHPSSSFFTSKIARYGLSGDSSELSSSCRSSASLSSFTERQCTGPKSSRSSAASASAESPRALKSAAMRAASPSPPPASARTTSSPVRCATRSANSSKNDLLSAIVFDLKRTTGFTSKRRSAKTFRRHWLKSSARIARSMRGRSVRTAATSLLHFSWRNFARG